MAGAAHKRLWSDEKSRSDGKQQDVDTAAVPTDPEK
jgi:hypothetical protein